MDFNKLISVVGAMLRVNGQYLFNTELCKEEAKERSDIQSRLTTALQWLHANKERTE